jgi:cell division protease FtsH
MLLLVWLWQGTLAQFSYRTIPYSEFKEHLRQHEVTKCVLREDDIQGEIQPKVPATTAEKEAATNSTATATSTNSTNSPSATKPATAETKPYLFRSVRVEDPKLVEDLQAAGVTFRGERPSIFSQFFISWIIPIGIMVLLWPVVRKPNTNYTR